MLFRPPEQIDERDLYTRSPFQVALLLFFTLGLYIFWWSYRARKSAAVLLEEPDSAGWKSVGLIVPLFNLYLLFELFQKIKVLAIRAGLQPPMTLEAYGIFGVLAILLFGRLPLPYAALMMLYCVPFTIAHVYLTRAQVAMAGAKAMPQPFGGIEILVLFVGGVFRMLTLVGYTFTPQLTLRSNAWFAWLMVAGVVAFMVYVRKISAAIPQPA